MRAYAYAWVRVGACVHACECVCVCLCESVLRFWNALKTNKKGCSKRRRKRGRWIQRKGERGGFLRVLERDGEWHKKSRTR